MLGITKGHLRAMSNDYIYWAFSAAAQSISAFVAFLLTGFALVHSIMESARASDDSLEEIHAALKVSHHRSLTTLAWLTGLAIILSLVVVYPFYHQGHILQPRQHAPHTTSPNDQIAFDTVW